MKLHPIINGRVVKILAEDELGCHRSVCSYVYPIAPPRQLLNPRFTARFVSMIPFKRDAGLTGGRVETWRSAHGTFSRMQGDVEDHAVLLCSLLLGWGLDAWIALGTIRSTPPQNGAPGPSAAFTRPYCWVVTFDVSNETSKPSKVTFWEPLSGNQYEVLTEQIGSNLSSNNNNMAIKSHNFHEIHMLFNNNCIALNIQSNCNVSNSTNVSTTKSSLMSFDITDNRSFKLFPSHGITPHLQHPGSKINISYSDFILQSSNMFGVQYDTNQSPQSIPSVPRNHLTVDALEILLETSLKDSLAEWRLSKERYTRFHDILGPILQVIHDIISY